jgi:hypothetical protein
MTTEASKPRGEFDRSVWKDSDFALIFSYFRETREIFKNCPERAGEFASVMLDDCERAGSALLCIMRGCGAV